jgi:superfamily I DNA/RNA helicase
LDADQVDAVLSLRCRWPRLISVVALAGSGKTRVALAVIAYWLGLVGLGKVNGNVLAATFTVVAAIELAERVKDLLGSTKGVVIYTWEHLYRILLRSLGLWEGALWSREEEVRWLIGKVGGDILDQFPERVDHAGLSYLLDKAVDLIVRDQPLNSRLDRILRPAWDDMRAEAARQGAILEDGVRKLAK